MKCYVKNNYGKLTCKNVFCSGQVHNTAAKTQCQYMLNSRYSQYDVFFLCIHTRIHLQPNEL